MALEIYWSKMADKKFDLIIEYLRLEWGESSISKFVKKLYDFLDTVKLLPEIGTLENSMYNIRGFVIFKQITLFYQIRANRIIILNFYDNRQKPTKRKY